MSRTGEEDSFLAEERLLEALGVSEDQVEQLMGYDNDGLDSDDEDDDMKDDGKCSWSLAHPAHANLTTPL